MYAALGARLLRVSRTRLPARVAQPNEASLNRARQRRCPTSVCCTNMESSSTYARAGSAHRGESLTVPVPAVGAELSQAEAPCTCVCHDKVEERKPLSHVFGLYFLALFRYIVFYLGFAQVFVEVYLWGWISRNWASDMRSTALICCLPMLARETWTFLKELWARFKEWRSPAEGLLRTAEPEVQR
jgi:hypothetical protein